MQDQGDDASVGPPIPQDAGDDLVGPAVPPEEAVGEDGDAWDGRGLGELDEQEDPYRLPVTSEVALEGIPCAPLSFDRVGTACPPIASHVHQGQDRTRCRLLLAAVVAV